MGMEPEPLNLPVPPPFPVLQDSPGQKAAGFSKEEIPTDRDSAPLPPTYHFSGNILTPNRKCFDEELQKRERVFVFAGSNDLMSIQMSPLKRCLYLGGSPPTADIGILSANVDLRNRDMSKGDFSPRPPSTDTCLLQVEL